jgi:cytosine/adenosine deaminase-related metal-dependent hydrolase
MIAGIHRIGCRPSADHPWFEIDLREFLIMPGLINAHDHLQYALHPRLGNPPYNNYLEWGEDIHATFPEVIGRYNAVPLVTRVLWGGIRNLLSGVTTVCHHDRLWPSLDGTAYPLNVIHDFGWAHSLALGGDIQDSHALTPSNAPFIVHACEGTDGLATDEIFELDRLGILDQRTIIVHGLGLDNAGIKLMHDRQSSLVICPSSNYFLFERLPDFERLRKIEKIAIGNDSPLTAVGDLLDEIRFAIEHGGVSPDAAYTMVTESPAALLHLTNGEGALRVSAIADLIAVANTNKDPAARLRGLTWKDVEFVMVRGKVQLTSDAVRNRLPELLQHGLERLDVEGVIRWVRAPVNALLRDAEEVLGKGGIRLSGREVTFSMLRGAAASATPFNGRRA